MKLELSQATRAFSPAPKPENQRCQTGSLKEEPSGWTVGGVGSKVGWVGMRSSGEEESQASPELLKKGSRKRTRMHAERGKAEALVRSVAKQHQASCYSKLKL